MPRDRTCKLDYGTLLYKEKGELNNWAEIHFLPHDAKESIPLYMSPYTRYVERTFEMLKLLLGRF